MNAGTEHGIFFMIFHCMLPVHRSLHRLPPQDKLMISAYCSNSPNSDTSAPWTLGKCHRTEQPVPRCSHIKAGTGQQCLNSLILSLHSSQTSIAAAVATPTTTTTTTTASAMFCTQTQRGPAQREAFVRRSKASRTCWMIKHCFDLSL